MPATKSRKFDNASNWTLAIIYQDKETTEDTLTDNPATLGVYFTKWRLQPRATKMELSRYHLNSQTNTELRVYFDNRVSTLNTLNIMGFT